MNEKITTAIDAILDRIIKRAPYTDGDELHELAQALVIAAGMAATIEEDEPDKRLIHYR